MCLPYHFFFYLSGSLKPSSCCLRQSQTVDLTLNGVREHMKRREKEHDRWTIECTAGLWKEVWEEASRGHPKIHTPSTVLVRAIERVRFQGRGQETSGPCVESVPVCVCMHRSVRTFLFGAEVTDQSQVALRSHLLSLVIWPCGPWPSPVSDCCRQDRNIRTHKHGCAKLYFT